MRVFPEPAGDQLRMASPVGQSESEGTCIKHHYGVLRFGPLKEVNLILAWRGDDLVRPTVADHVSH